MAEPSLIWLTCGPMKLQPVARTLSWVKTTKRRRICVRRRDTGLVNNLFFYFPSLVLMKHIVVLHKLTNIKLSSVFFQNLTWPVSLNRKINFQCLQQCEDLSLRNWPDLNCDTGHWRATLGCSGILLPLSKRRLCMGSQNQLQRLPQQGEALLSPSITTTPHSR